MACSARIFSRCPFNLFYSPAQPPRLRDGEVKQGFPSTPGYNRCSERLSLSHDNHAAMPILNIRGGALTNEEATQFFVALLFDNFDLVIEVLFDPSNILFFDGPGAFVFLSPTP
jgi:hypothetical protein